MVCLMSHIRPPHVEDLLVYSVRMRTRQRESRRNSPVATGWLLANGNPPGK